MRPRDPDAEPPPTLLDEKTEDDRRQIPGQLMRWSLAFAALFAGVFLCFWWSGAAIRFGASRIAERPEATWRIFGTVRSSSTQEPIPWAVIEDDPSGRPPFYRSDAGRNGEYSLLTLAEPHRIRVAANGFRSTTLAVGRHWFLWWPRGEERKDIELEPD